MKDPYLLELWERTTLKGRDTVAGEHTPTIEVTRVPGGFLYCCLGHGVVFTPIPSDVSRDILAFKTRHKSMSTNISYKGEG